METRRFTSIVQDVPGDGLKTEFQQILVIQTAFLGDAILTLPLIQAAKKKYPHATIDVAVTPQAAGLFANHPAIGKIIRYDKRAHDKGVLGFNRIRKGIAAQHYDLAIVPHRSIRSALLASTSGIPVRIGFDRSAGRFLFSDIVRYRADAHEIERNLSLLTALGVENTERILPSLYPGEEDRSTIERLIEYNDLNRNRDLIAIAPGTIWNTKRWLTERFAELARRMSEEGGSVVLVGSQSDRVLCEEISTLAKTDHILNTAGTLSLLQSVELIRRCRIIISNDSAPMHMAVAVRTPVVAIFGATVPAFGFAPYGDHDVVIETLGLHCRPCSVHGGHTCPITTFDCMRNIDVERVLTEVHKRIDSRLLQ